MTEKEFQEYVIKQLSSISERLEQVKEDTEITREATNSLIEWAEFVSERLDITFPVK